jgi:hypothetical protein
LSHTRRPSGRLFPSPGVHACGTDAKTDRLSFPFGPLQGTRTTAGPRWQPQPITSPGRGLQGKRTTRGTPSIHRRKRLGWGKDGATADLRVTTRRDRLGRRNSRHIAFRGPGRNLAFGFFFVRVVACGRMDSRQSRSTLNGNHGQVAWAGKLYSWSSSWP